ncbi:metal transporter CNNM3-like isoform X2 [Tachypleus tridentatus]|uniref:metal transporter CNNM3-like isoform X2 n=1 Tax=Tachypleus tridentatus TaxID=6853 RepID=UPI003FD37B41
MLSVLYNQNMALRCLTITEIIVVLVIGFMTIHSCVSDMLSGFQVIKSFTGTSGVENFKSSVKWNKIHARKISPALADSSRNASNAITSTIASATSIDRFVPVVVTGLRGEGSKVLVSTSGASLIPANQEVTLRLFGVNFTKHTAVAFTTVKQPKGSNCNDLPTTEVVYLQEEGFLSSSAVVIQLSLPDMESTDQFYFMCVKNNPDLGKTSGWIHQGDDPWMRIRTERALELKKKTAAEIMTKIEDVFMIPIDSILDFETMSEILKQGYTRIPVYDTDRNNIVFLLFTKDLAFVDPEDNTPVKTLCEFYNHPISYVYEDETLDVLLEEFKKGRSHMAFVHYVNNEGEGDPFYVILGVVTLEDVIEEIIQSEIVDETDTVSDNRCKKRRKDAQVKQDFSDFAKIGEGQQGKNIISPQLALATFQYLSTSVEPFGKELISATVLRRLMAQNIFFTLKMRSRDDANAPAMTIYQAGKPSDYFVLILEGRVRVQVGKENLVFEGGPFTYFGCFALTGAIIPGESTSQLLRPGSSPSLTNAPSELSLLKATFIPDYTVVAVSDTSYMKVHRAVYLAAYRASCMERQQQRSDFNLEDPFKGELEKVLNTVNILGGHSEQIIISPTAPFTQNFCEDFSPPTSHETVSRKKNEWHTPQACVEAINAPIIANAVKHNGTFSPPLLSILQLEAETPKIQTKEEVSIAEHVKVEGVGSEAAVDVTNQKSSECLAKQSSSLSSTEVRR